MQRTRSKSEATIARGLIIAAIAIVVTLQVGMSNTSGANTVGNTLWRYYWETIYYSDDPASLYPTVFSVGDVDGNGGKEIIMSFLDRVSCFSRGGSLKWDLSITGTSIPALEQCDSDNALEIVISHENYLECRKGIDGHLSWSLNLPGLNPGKYAAADVDGDGFAEIFATTNNNRIHCVSGYNGSVRWSSPTSMSLATPLIADANGDGIAEIIAGSSNGTLACLMARNGSIVWSTILGTAAIAPLAVCDVDGTGSLGLIVKTNTLSLVYGLNGTTKWQLPSSSIPIESAVIGDINRDGQLEAVISPPKSSNGYIYCFSVETGAQLWRTASYYLGVMMQLADINNDGTWEACFSHQDGLVALSGDNGTVSWNYLDSDLTTGLVISDINADGYLEMVYANCIEGKIFHNYVLCKQLFSSYWAIPPPWPCIAGSERRTNSYLDADDDGIPTSLELSLGTNPAIPDSDGDGWDDGDEINNLTNPLNPNEIPVNLIAPANGQQFFNQSVTFTWMSIPSISNSTTFQWQVSNSSSFTMIVDEVSCIPNTLRVTSITRDIDLPTGIYYWRVRPVYGALSGNWSRCFNFTCIRNHDPPSLVNGTMTPASGDQFTNFTFSVAYIDPDDNPPANMTLHINGTMHAMIKQDANDTNYADGCIYVYTCQFPHTTANYSYYYSYSDGRFSNTTVVVSGPSVTELNCRTPQLLNSHVSPLAGINMSIFTFTVLYKDEDNNLPVSITITINGSIYVMIGEDNLDLNALNGKIYSYSTPLPLWGRYHFQVNCSDGIFENSTGLIEAPELNPLLLETIFEDNFENGSAQWSTINGLWHVTGASSRWPNSYRSANHSMWYGSESTGIYRRNSWGDLITIQIDLSQYQYVMLEFYHWMILDDDYAAINIRRNAASSWREISHFSSSKTPWQKCVLDISPYCNTGANAVQIKFTFSSGNYGDCRGWLIDDVKICGKLKNSKNYLLAPTNQSALFTGPINFLWKSFKSIVVSNFTYQWQLSCTLSFTGIIDEVWNIPKTTTTTNITRNIDVSPGIYYWRVRPVYGMFYGNWSKDNYFTCLPNYDPPSLVNGTVTPASGSHLSNFTFSATYVDPDDNPPVNVSVHINGTTYAMSKQNISDTNYTDGCVYACSICLSFGSYSYNFTASDGKYSVSTQASQGPVVTNAAPSLTNCSLSLANGTILTTFTFEAIYTDADNNVPSYVTVYIDATPFTMSKQTPSDMNYTDGCVYTCSKQLTVGSHFYYFTASDGAVSATTPTQ
nr:PQQ-binding-like beta-propeller repeat protein [Candidatus Sigynarchaeota archaeon]